MMHFSNHVNGMMTPRIDKSLAEPKGQKVFITASGSILRKGVSRIGLSGTWSMERSCDMGFKSIKIRF